MPAVPERSGIPYEVRLLRGEEGWRWLPALARVLVDCVEGGASVSYMLPFSKSEAEAAFAGVLASVERGERFLFAAFVGQELVGTVQLSTDMPPNQPHRAEIAKLLVLRSARGRGIGRLLLQRAEQQAQALGKTLLVLDTAVNGGAERLYENSGWIRVGVIPRYALYPDGRWGDTAIYWKALP